MSERQWLGRACTRAGGGVGLLRTHGKRSGGRILQPNRDHGVYAADRAVRSFARAADVAALMAAIPAQMRCGETELPSDKTLACEDRRVPSVCV